MSATKVFLLNNSITGKRILILSCTDRILHCRYILSIATAIPERNGGDERDGENSSSDLH